MLQFSYTHTGPLKKALQHIDTLRIQILTTPITPRAELQLRWEALLDRIYYTLLLNGQTINKKTLLSLMVTAPLLQQQKTMTQEAKNIMHYKNALDYIGHTWLGSEEPVTLKTITYLHALGCSGNYRKEEGDLKHLVDYLQTSTEHPVIQAAVAYIGIHRLKPFTDGNGQLASLLSLLFLYKAGYEYRGLLSLEKEWLLENDSFIEKLEQGIHSTYITNWIEYVATSLTKSLEKTLQNVQSTRKATKKTFFDLTERQKTILSLLEAPDAHVTNRQIQRMFTISQITASRNLAHLVSLGLILPHGKGRSIFYTRA